MINYRKILSLHFQGASQRTIEIAVSSSRNTIREVLKRAKVKQLTSLTEEMSDHWLEDYLFPEKSPVTKGYHLEDWEYVHTELGKKHITLKLLHQEYARKAKESGSVPYAYRTYCTQYQNYALKHKVTMPLHRKPGEILELDWAGSTLFLKNMSGGVNIPVYIFVATFPFSQYFYAEGFLDMKSQSWLTAHIHAFEFFDGVPEILIPDNLKTGVIKADRDEPLINSAYRDLADYYDTVILPTRTRHPKDKASVESSVGFVSRQIIAALRNVQCFHLSELNQLILEKVKELNQVPFQKKLGSRQSSFLEEESSYLKPLRKPSFEITDWKVAKVQSNYHIQLERNYYSVPYEYVHHQVNVRLREDLIEVYYKQNRISSHKRIKHQIGVYSTNKNHMPEHHQSYLEHTPTSSLEWAELVGPHTHKLIEELLVQQTEKRALKMISGIQKLQVKHSAYLIERCSEILLSISKQPTLATFKRILEDETSHSKRDARQIKDELHGFVRGAEYFRRER